MSGGEEADGDESGEPLDTEVLFQTLSNQRRRFVVHALEQHDNEIELRNLSTQVAAWENEKDVEAVTSTERRRVYNSLQQVHLPQMDRDDVVDYDKRAGTIRPTGEIADLNMYLEIVPDNDISWGTYYSLLGAFSVLFTAAVVGGVPPFDGLPVLPSVVTPGLLVVLSGLAHVYVSRQRQLGSNGVPPELRAD